MAKSVLKEDGVPIGNVYEKYDTNNPLARKLVDHFNQTVLELAKSIQAKTLHELGCGEGHLTEILASIGFEMVKGSDFSTQMIELAASRTKGSSIEFKVRDIYNLRPEDTADLIVCCEVLEHLEDPMRALKSIRSLNPNHCIFSVPREPLWRALNMLRGKYWSDWGNTPGHLQHWSSQAFERMVATEFNILKVRRPLPWTMLLCKPKPFGGS